LTVYVGTAGFSYADWKGNFYPSDISGRSMLEEYARNFPVVEINSTYYAIPPPDRMNAMANRTPVDFQFNVKANRGMTHETGGDPVVFEEFKRAVRPLADHGKLGCVLFQFPWGFKNNRENREYLERLKERMDGLDCVVEFRNSGWESEEVFRLLCDLDFGYCCVDEPRLKGLPSDRVEVTSATGYVRFHGRNSETWWGKDREAWERYDYLYGKKELGEWLPKIERIEENTDRTYVIFNNHYKGQAPANARMFEVMLRDTMDLELFTVEPETGWNGTLF
jgi:uncharacterized protein YecE (DUF72 family)